MSYSNNKVPATEAEAVSAYTKLVYKIAHKYRRQSGVELDDLAQEGFIGLLKAYRSFDPAKGAFLLHATIGISGAVRNYLDERRFTGPVKLYHKLNKAQLKYAKGIALLDASPVLFRSDVNPEEVMAAWEHPIEEQLSEHELQRLRAIKKQIARYNHLGYEDAVEQLQAAEQLRLQTEVQTPTPEESRTQVVDSVYRREVLAMLDEETAFTLLLDAAGFSKTEIVEELHSRFGRIGTTRQSGYDMLAEAKRKLEVVLKTGQPPAQKPEPMTLTYQGRTQLLSAWAKELGMSQGAIYFRVGMDWPVEKILLHPLSGKHTPGQLALLKAKSTTEP